MEDKTINTLMKVIVAIVIIVGIIFISAIYLNSWGNTNEEEEIKTKVEEEIRYLDTKLLTLINYLNNIDLQNYKLVLTEIQTQSDSSNSSSKKEEKSDKAQDASDDGTDKEETTITKVEEETIVGDNKEVDWKTIEGEIQILCTTWPTVILDLYKIDVPSEDILGFSDSLDEVMLSIKNKDKNMTGMYLAKLYGYLPIYINKLNIEDLKKRTLEAKSYIINAYAYVQTNSWDNVEFEVERARNLFSSLVNDASYVEDGKKYNINKAYILIEELKNSLSEKDSGIFYIKYKTVLEELNMIN